MAVYARNTHRGCRFNVKSAENIVKVGGVCLLLPHRLHRFRLAIRVAARSFDAWNVGDRGAGAWQFPCTPDARPRP